MHFDGVLSQIKGCQVVGNKAIYPGGHIQN